MEEKRTRFLEYQVVTFQKLISIATPGTKLKKHSNKLSVNVRYEI